MISAAVLHCVFSGYLPNGVEAIEAMLATASIGAVWSSASPDFGITVSSSSLQSLSLHRYESVALALGRTRSLFSS